MNETKAFVKLLMSLLSILKTFYKKDGRSYLPWRKTKNPYKILVSEMMLQQTQVERVIPKYTAFLQAFPTVTTLAEAPLSEVLALWSGLGYNRRAKFLHQAAKAVVGEHTGLFPKQVAELEKLPGIGPYTARAVAAFAYNQPVVLIETNVRTVVLYHFGTSWLDAGQVQHNNTGENMKKQRVMLRGVVSDVELLPLVGDLLKKSKMQPRDFYAALMDYGSHLKRSGVRLNSKSKGYIKQSKFTGSARELRGAILRELLKHARPAPLAKLSISIASGIKVENTDVFKSRLKQELGTLVAEGLLIQKNATYAVAK